MTIAEYYARHHDDGRAWLNLQHTAWIVLEPTFPGRHAYRACWASGRSEPVAGTDPVDHYRGRATAWAVAADRTRRSVSLDLASAIVSALTRSPRPTYADIAGELQVSISTVSKLATGKHPLSGSARVRA